MRKRYSAAFKAQLVVELLKEEQTVNQLAAKHGVHPTQLRDWKKQVLDGLPNLFGGTKKQATKTAPLKLYKYPITRLEKASPGRTAEPV